MARTKAGNGKLKQAVKEALHDVLVEDREFLRAVLLEAIEDIGLAEAILEARKTNKFVPRSTITKILRGKK
jgi:hypothetical protein